MKLGWGVRWGSVKATGEQTLGRLCGVAALSLGPLGTQPMWQKPPWAFLGILQDSPGRRGLAGKLLHLREKSFRRILIPR